MAEDVGPGPATSRTVGPRDPVRRVVRLLLVLLALTLVVSFVLVTATRVQVALDILGEDRADLFLTLSVVIMLAHVYLVFLARKRRLAEVQHWIWLLFPVHLVWGTGFLVGIPEAVPIGIGLAMLDLLVVMWAADAIRELE